MPSAITARLPATSTFSMPRPWRSPSISPARNIRKSACSCARKTCLVISAGRTRTHWTIFAGSGKRLSRRAKTFLKKPRIRFAGSSGTMSSTGVRMAKDFSISCNSGCMAPASIFSTNRKARFRRKSS